MSIPSEWPHSKHLLLKSEIPPFQKPFMRQQWKPFKIFTYRGLKPIKIKDIGSMVIFKHKKYF